MTPPPRLPAGAGATSSISEESVEVLNQRLADARQAEPGRAWAAGAPKAAAEAAVPSPAAAAAGATGEDQPSFLASTDNDLAHALNERIGLLGGGGGGGGEEGEVLTGAQLRELIYSKYGKHYDVSFVRRDLPLGKVPLSADCMRRPSRRRVGVLHVLDQRGTGGCGVGVDQCRCQMPHPTRTL